MRLSLAAAALATVAATAVPADAAYYPVCATRLALAATGASTYCTAGNTQHLGTQTLRHMDVEVLSGTVRARIECTNPYYPYTPVFSEKDVSGPVRVRVTTVERPNSSCKAILTALSYDTTAVGVSTFSYVFIQTEA